MVLIKGRIQKIDGPGSPQEPRHLRVFFGASPLPSPAGEGELRNSCNKAPVREHRSLIVQTGTAYCLLAAEVVGNREGSATFGATAGDDLAAIFGSHSLAEAVLVDSSAIGGLERSFHLYSDFN